LKRSATIFMRWKISTAFCSKAPDRSPAWAPQSPASCATRGRGCELKVQFTNDSMKTLLRTHIEHDVRRLDQSVQAFARQLADFMQIETLNQQGQFKFFRRLLNYDDWRVAGSPQSTSFSTIRSSTPTSKPNAIISGVGVTSSGC